MSFIRSSRRISSGSAVVCRARARVALRFIASVEDAISRVLDAPTRWRVNDEDVRRCLIRVFPYAVLFTIEAAFLLIVAVMHCSREPNYWRLRVEALNL